MSCILVFILEIQGFVGGSMFPCLKVLREFQLGAHCG